MTELKTPRHERVRDVEAATGLDLKVRFVLPVPTAEVEERLAESMEGTQLRLIRLEGDSGRWEAVLSAPTGALTPDDVERFLARARASLPARCSVILSGVRHPEYTEAPVDPPAQRRPS